MVLRPPPPHPASGFSRWAWPFSLVPGSLGADCAHLSLLSAFLSLVSAPRGWCCFPQEPQHLFVGAATFSPPSGHRTSAG